MMVKLEGKVAIVTGAGQGIGRGIALAFAKEGAKVVIAEINAATAKSVEKEINDLGTDALAVVCDVGNEKQVKSMVDQAVRQFGPIDIMVNNAQILGKLTPAESVLEESWDIVFQTGVKATWYCCKAVFPHMKDRGGKIINLGSGSGILGFEGQSDYSANKEAIRGLSRTLAREWGKYWINVNVICPSATTPLHAAFYKANPKAKIESTTPSRILNRLGDPEKDIGRAAVFLASEDADFITGQTLMVDGGNHMF